MSKCLVNCNDKTKKYITKISIQNICERKRKWYKQNHLKAFKAKHNKFLII